MFQYIIMMSHSLLSLGKIKAAKLIVSCSTTWT